MLASIIDSPVRLTELAHGGGCGCKIAPSVLSDILKGVPQMAPVADLLVGTETSDDAAVYRINERQAVVATTDFFMPIVDDPYDFGRIAACNALSDIFAMGARPLFALAIVGMPLGKIGTDVIRAILAGGAAMCSGAGIPVAGGHSIDSVEPIYGLAAVGLVDPNRVFRNSTAQSGDVLILTKRLGIGIFSAALKKGLLDEANYTEMLSSTTQLNAVGAEIAGITGVHAMTDVTGFGLLGHTLEMCRGASLSVEIDMGSLPIFPAALDLAERGIATGASKRNWDSYGHDVGLPPHCADWRRVLLCDPQTSGGLLIACAASAAPRVLDILAQRGFGYARQVGAFRQGPAKINVSDG